MIRRWLRRARPRSGAGTPARRLVVLPLSVILGPALDALAECYRADPATVGAVLRAHADAVLTLDLAVVADAAEDWQRAVATERADATRTALLTLTLPAATRRDPNGDTP